jgi:glycosyltransferase involved in cell wall biosynthesis
MQTNPKISIIVPVYNIEKNLSDCIDSILACELSDIEILLIDDGSTDFSGKICDTYAEKNRQIVVHHKENGGVSNTRNFGIEKAIGEWIIFIDGDDRVVSEQFEQFKTILLDSTENIQIIINDVIINRYSQSIVQKNRGATLDEVLINSKSVWNVWRYAFKKEFILESNAKYDNKLSFAEDLKFTFSVLSAENSSFAVVHSPYYIYNHRTGSTLSSITPTKIFSLYRTCFECRNMVRGRKDKTAKLLRKKLNRDMLLTPLIYIREKVRSK